MDEYLWVFIVIACLAIFGLIVVFGRKPKEAKPAFTLSTDDNPYEKEPEKREVAPEAATDAELDFDMANEVKEVDETEPLELPGLEVPPVNPVFSSAAYLPFDKPIAGEFLKSVASHLADTIPAPLTFYAKDTKENLWFAPKEGATYSAFAAVIALAGKSFVLDEIAASRFIAELTQVAIRFETEAEIEDATAMVSRARFLKAAIEAFDVEIAIALQSPAIVPLRDYLDAAKAAGFTHKTGGVCVYAPAKGAYPYIKVTRDDESLGSIMMTLDAPCAKVESAPLTTLFTLANDLASRLKLTITDGASNEITLSSIHDMSHQVEAFYAEMQKAGLVPGSVEVIRLFER
ncbi:MAG TPA: hypothetical protein DCW60_01595 [Sutterella sp.]|nr:hypothetical protein [Sutterella sp.]